MSFFEKRHQSIARAKEVQHELDEIAAKVEEDAPLAKAFGQWWASRRIENGIELDLRYDMTQPRLRTARGKT